MAYGLQIINDDGELLIDSEYFNPTFVQKIEFNTTATFTEASTGFLHPGYIKREYTSSTAVPSIGVGSNYIVMWTLPDNGTNSIYYQFESSIGYSQSNLVCYVFANDASLTYTLPTAYVFAVDVLGVENLGSSGPALRMYNSANPQRKTFDSNFMQLVPYSITDSFALSTSGTGVANYGTTDVSINLSVPTNPIFLLPESQALRISKGPTNSLWHTEYGYKVAYRRTGTTLYTRNFVTYYSYEDYAWPTTLTSYTSGNSNQLSVIVANADFYQSSGAGGGGGGSNPTYTLSSSYTVRDEGTTVRITLTTTLVSNGSEFPYTVSGIQAADLTAGGYTGTFVINNNTAYIDFTFANDLLTEGTETFRLSLDNLSQYIDVNVNDTSTASSFSWDAANPVDEGSTAYTVFRATAAAGKTVSFEVWDPDQTGGPFNVIGAGDGTLDTTSWTISGNGATSVNVYYTATADAATEGPEYFRIRAVVDGLPFLSGNIRVNDTSLTAPTYSLTRSAASVNEGGSFTVTFATNQSGSFPYTITGVTSADIGGASLTGSVTNGTVLTYNVTADTTTEGTETFNIALNNGNASTSVTINDTSVSANYSLTRSVASVNEGGSFTVTFATNQSGSFPYTITGVTSADIGGASLTGSVTNGTVLTYNVTADTTTEGTETFNIALDNGQASTSVTINDTSLTPATYTLSRSASSVNEGGSFTITFTTNQSGSFPYTITGVTSADISGASLTGIVSNNSQLSYTVAADTTTEGTETFNIALDNGQASTSVTINDTSLTPAATYSFSTSAASVNEGDSFTITFATNQSGSFAYTITGVTSADISGASLTGTVSNNSQLTYTVSADSTTEGTETFSITLNNGLSNARTVTINDTSTTPAPSYSLTNTFSTLDNNSSQSFTYNATNANGTTVTVTSNNARATVNPSSFTINSNSFTRSITVTTTSPTSSVSSTTARITCSPGSFFDFTIPAVTVTAPIWYAYDNTTAPLSWTVPAGRTSIRVALVGGGGGGGGGPAGTTPAKGGGGAGKVLDITSYAVSPGQVLTFTAGAAGSGGFSPTAGGASSVSGGSGGTQSAAGGSPGSGFTGGASGTPFSGGSGNSGAGGGGGGSASTGFPGAAGEGGDGGFGTSITTNATYYVAGGGGGASRSAIPGAGDAGAGMGASSNTVTSVAGDAATFYGSGGGGGVNGGNGGAGFRGIVMWLG